MAAGQTQIITKVASSTAHQAFDETAALVPVPKQQDMTADLFVEHGLTASVTLQGKLYAASTQLAGGSGGARYDGDLGLRWTALERHQAVLGFYAGVTLPVAKGEGVGRGGLEARLLMGRSARLAGRSLFVEVQAARLTGNGYGTQTRLETTFGADMARNWQALLQLQGGRAEVGGEWFNAEGAVLRQFGRSSLQIGWRQTLGGVNQPRQSGPVIALWRRF